MPILFDMMLATARFCRSIFLGVESLKTTFNDAVRFEILRVETHFEIERLIDKATENGFAVDDAIDALEQALDAMRSYRSARERYSKTPHLF